MPTPISSSTMRLMAARRLNSIATCGVTPAWAKNSSIRRRVLPPRSPRISFSPASAYEQLLSPFGENDFARRAHEQSQAGLGFQLANLHANRRLRYVDASRSCGERAGLRDGHKSFELSDFHLRSYITVNYRMNKIF